MDPAHVSDGSAVHVQPHIIKSQDASFRSRFRFRRRHLFCANRPLPYVIRLCLPARHHQPCRSPPQLIPSKALCSSSRSLAVFGGIEPIPSFWNRRLASRQGRRGISPALPVPGIRAQSPSPVGTAEPLPILEATCFRRIDRPVRG